MDLTCVTALPRRGYAPPTDGSIRLSDETIRAKIEPRSVVRCMVAERQDSPPLDVRLDLTIEHSAASDFDPIVDFQCCGDFLVECDYSHEALQLTEGSESEDDDADDERDDEGQAYERIPSDEALRHELERHERERRAKEDAQLTNCTYFRAYNWEELQQLTKQQKCNHNAIRTDDEQRPDSDIFPMPSFEVPCHSLQSVHASSPHASFDGSTTSSFAQPYRLTGSGPPRKINAPLSSPFEFGVPCTTQRPRDKKPLSNVSFGPHKRPQRSNTPLQRRNSKSIAFCSRNCLDGIKSIKILGSESQSCFRHQWSRDN